ncbi:MAG: discoidin domain-containing protein [Odoribacter sp.]|nr:discoidin domain-containing protein [Odoribacter sp.]
MTANYVSKDLADKDFEKRSGDEQFCPYIQLAYGLGWGVYKYLGIQNRTSQDYENSDQGKKDFLAKRVAEYAGANMLPFFDDWGIALSNAARKYIALFPNWLETERGKKVGEFWKHFEYGPVTDPAEFDFYNEPDPSTFPDVHFGEADRSNWTVIGIEGGNVTGDKDVDGRKECLIDNSNSTCVMWAKPGVTYGSVKGVAPVTITIDMGAGTSFNYYKLRNRTVNGNSAFNPKAVSLYGSNDGINFTIIQKDYVISNYSDTEISISLDKMQTYRYLKLEVEQWTSGTRSCIAIADFRVGME